VSNLVKYFHICIFPIQFCLRTLNGLTLAFRFIYKWVLYLGRNTASHVMVSFYYSLNCRLFVVYMSRVCAHHSPRELQ